MSLECTSRRALLKTTGALGAAAAIPTVSAASEEWTIEATPTDGALYDVAYTSEGAYAVGGAASSWSAPGRTGGRSPTAA